MEENTQMHDIGEWNLYSVMDHKFPSGTASLKKIEKLRQKKIFFNYVWGERSILWKNGTYCSCLTICPWCQEFPNRFSYGRMLLSIGDINKEANCFLQISKKKFSALNLIKKALVV